MGIDYSKVFHVDNIVVAYIHHVLLSVSYEIFNDFEI